MKQALIITEKQDTFNKIGFCIGQESGVEIARDTNTALKMLQSERFEFIFIDLGILKGTVSNNNYKESLRPFYNLYPTIEIVIMTSKDRMHDAVKAVKAGASDYITMPIDAEEIKYVVDSIHENKIVKSELDYLRDKLLESDSKEHIFSINPLMIKLYEKIKAVAPTRSTVLLTGETGTGKNLLAKLIHKNSNRNDKQFISVHCGAIPDTLLESELFGHEKGSFTGAVKRKLGKFEIADGGTIFLDEVGTITSSAQIKLLQVLQERIFHRIGGEKEIETDVRIIAATNIDLKAMCEEGSFRKDLFYRLNVFPVDVPSLQERIEDIPNLVKGFLKKMNSINLKDINSIDPHVLSALKKYSWPGNIRELENIIERAYILETDQILTRDSFPAEIIDSESIHLSTPVNAELTLAQVRRRGIDKIEQTYLKELLTTNRGRIKESAETAGITTRQLHKLMVKYGIKKEEFKKETLLTD